VSYKLKCPACGHSCREILFSSVEGCTNPKCKFFEKEAAEVLQMMAEAERMLREAMSLA